MRPSISQRVVPDVVRGVVLGTGFGAWPRQGKEGGEKRNAPNALRPLATGGLRGATCPPFTLLVPFVLPPSVSPVRRPFFPPCSCPHSARIPARGGADPRTRRCRRLRSHPVRLACCWPAGPVLIPRPAPRPTDVRSIRPRLGLLKDHRSSNSVPNRHGGGTRKHRSLYQQFVSLLSPTRRPNRPHIILVMSSRCADRGVRQAAKSSPRRLCEPLTGA